MAKKTKKDESELSEAEATKRATEALRRALATPYKSQRELVGKKPTPNKRRQHPDKS